MTLLIDATEEKKFDSRVVERNVQRGFAKADDYEKFVKELPDDSENAEIVSIDALIAENSN
jgi:hypothetical protein